jgi:hypothetical protein
MSRPEPLSALADLLAAEPLLEPYVDRGRDDRAALGELAACGPRTRAEADAYALIVETVYEGYRLHYDVPRLLSGIEPDLALLAGDHLYALGLDRLAALGDLDSVRELSDLISLAAQLHDGDRPAEVVASEAHALWLATATAIAAGSSDGYQLAKAALRAGEPGAAAALREAAERTAAESGIQHDLEVAFKAIDFAVRTPPELG